AAARGEAVNGGARRGGAAAGLGFAAAGALCGLAAATKYTGGLAIVFVLAMALQSDQRWRMVTGSLAGALFAFATPSAIALLHPADYASGLAFLGGRGFGYHYGTPLGWVYHPTVSLPFGIGLGAYAMALGGLIVAAITRSKPDRPLLAFAAGHLLRVPATHQAP